MSPAAAHALLMSLGFMPLFIVGFLFTAGPKWLGQPEVSAQLARTVAGAAGRLVRDSAWVALVAVAPLVERLSAAGLAWLIAGGLSYTAGAIVSLFGSSRRCAHFVWHLFVLGGSTCHFFAALWHEAARYVRSDWLARLGQQRRHARADELDSTGWPAL